MYLGLTMDLGQMRFFWSGLDLMWAWSHGPGRCFYSIRVRMGLNSSKLTGLLKWTQQDSWTLVIWTLMVLDSSHV